MFGKRNKVDNDQYAQSYELSHVPGMTDATQIYYAAFHAHDASLRFARKAQLGLLCIIAGLVLALILMMPLRKVETRVFEVETATGRTVISDKTPKMMLEVSDRVRQKMQEFFLREFAANVTTLDTRTLKERIPAASAMLSDKRAENAFEEYIYKIEKIPEKIAQNPSLTREYRHKTISTSADGKTAFVRFERIEKINGAEQNVVPMMMTIEFVFVPEEPGKEKDINPMGLRVTYFTVALDI